MLWSEGERKVITLACLTHFASAVCSALMHSVRFWISQANVSLCLGSQPGETVLAWTQLHHIQLTNIQWRGKKKWPQCANLKASDAAALNKRLVGNMMWLKGFCSWTCTVSVSMEANVDVPEFKEFRIVLSLLGAGYKLVNIAKKL